MQLTPRNINEAIKALKSNLTNSQNEASYFLVPKCEKVLSSRYKGSGRPCKSDYDYIDIDWSTFTPN